MTDHRYIYRPSTVRVPVQTFLFHADCIFRRVVGCAMSASTPHVGLAGFGYLEPLSRPLVCEDMSVIPAMPAKQPNLARKAMRVTDRLACESNWLQRSPRAAAFTSAFASPCASSTSIPASPSSVMSSSATMRSPRIHVDSITSSYARYGTWDSNSPVLPKAVMPRQPVDTPLQRRMLATDAWHVPPPSGRSTDSVEQYRSDERRPFEALQKQPWRNRSPMSLAKGATLLVI